MKQHTRTHPAWWPQAQQQGLVQGPAPAPEGPSAWIIAVALLGAIVCALPLLALVILVFADALDANGMTLIGILLIAGAAAILRQPLPLFASCMGLVLWSVGSPLVVSKIVWDGEGSVASFLMASTTLLLLQLIGIAITRIRWVQHLMGLAAGIALFAIMLCSSTWWPTVYALQLPLLVMAAAWSCWVATEHRRLPHAQHNALRNTRASTWALAADAMLLGALLAAMLTPTPEILFGEWLSGMSERYANAHYALMQQRAVLASIATAAATLWLAWRWRAYQHSAPAVLWLLWLAGSLLTIGAWFSPSLSLLAVLAVGAVATARWRIAVLCGLLALLLLNLFYYNLEWSLTDKGLGLIALGAVWLLVLILVRRSAQPRPSTATPAPARTAWMPRAGVVLGALMVFAVVNWDVRGKEQVIAHGDRILVPLAPVDPRSLMQGDYMTLRFAFPDAVQQALQEQFGSTLHVLAQLDPQGMATVQRLAQPGESVAADQVILPLKRLKGTWTLVTDAYFFPEGQGEFFEAARFGDFRVLPNGRALLVGLADASGHPMQYPSQAEAPPILQPASEAEPAQDG